MFSIPIYIFTKENSTAHTTDSLFYIIQSQHSFKKGLRIPIPRRHCPAMRQAAGMCLYLLPWFSKDANIKRDEETTVGITRRHTSQPGVEHRKGFSYMSGKICARLGQCERDSSRTSQHSIPCRTGSTQVAHGQPRFRFRVSKVSAWETPVQELRSSQGENSAESSQRTAQHLQLPHPLPAVTEVETSAFSTGRVAEHLSRKDSPFGEPMLH